MQLQIECNPAPLQSQTCLICKRLFEMTEAKIIVCNDHGNNYGEVCPQCLQRGFDWLSDRFEQLNHSHKTITIQRPRQQKIPIGVSN